MLAVTCGVYPDNCLLPLNCGSCSCTRETVETGFTSPQRGETIDGTGSPWNIPEGIESGDNRSASLNLSASRRSSEVLRASAFGFTLPPDAEILGIEVLLQRTTTPGEIKDVSATLNRRRDRAGIENKKDFQSWFFSGRSHTYGASDELWGIDWTPVDINDDAFSFDLRVNYTERSGNATASVASIAVNVHYTRCAM